MQEYVLDIATIVLVTVAIVNRIKAEIPEIKSFWYLIMSIGIGAALYAVSLYLPQVVTNFILVGAAASGIFDVYAKRGVE